MTIDENVINEYAMCVIDKELNNTCKHTEGGYISGVLEFAKILKEALEMDIKRCPFCGGEAEIITGTQRDGNTHYYEHHVKCSKCGARTKKFATGGYYGEWNTEDDAITAWNQREGTEMRA